MFVGEQECKYAKKNKQKKLCFIETKNIDRKNGLYNCISSSAWHQVLQKPTNDPLTVCDEAVKHLKHTGQGLSVRAHCSCRELYVQIQFGEIKNHSEPTGGLGLMWTAANLQVKDL